MGVERGQGSLQLAGQRCAPLEGVGQARRGRFPLLPPTSTCPSYKASGEEGLPLFPGTPEMKTALLFLVALAVASGPGEGLAGGWGQWGAGPWKPGVAHL